jgi:thiamine thiazole synthase
MRRDMLKANNFEEDVMFDDVGISEAILDSYGRKLRECLRNDVVVVGAGPSGMTAAFYLASRGIKTTIVERKLAPGGGIWGGGMGMNDVVFQKEALPILKDAGVRAERKHGELYVVEAVELAAALCLKALHAGAIMLNLVTVEDLCVKDNRVRGVVVNRTGISGVYHVDPIVLEARAVLDGTGHDAGLVHFLMKHKLMEKFSAANPPYEGPMDAPSGERFVVENTGEVYPGLWLSGMSVCSTYGGPRMGPIFGGMLLSGKKAAEMIAADLRK